MKKTAPVGPGNIQLATFVVGAQEYALDIMGIKEIIQPPPITHVPRMPPFVEGMIELRGTILPLVDLRKRFEVPAPAATRATKVIIADIAKQAVGLVVDGVGEVLRLPRTELTPPPPLAGGERSFFTAVCRRPGRLILVLDLERVLSAEEKFSLAGLVA